MQKSSSSSSSSSLQMVLPARPNADMFDAKGKREEPKVIFFLRLQVVSKDSPSSSKCIQRNDGLFFFSFGSALKSFSFPAWNLNKFL